MLPLVALAVFVVWMLYFRKQENSVLLKPVRIALAISRLLVILIIGLLVISPWIRTEIDKQIKPWYVIAKDNSVSIPPASDSQKFISNRASLLKDLSESLNNRFQVKEIQFGSQVSEGFQDTYSDPVTDPGELFDYLRLFAQTHDLGGVLVATDGVSTRGLAFAEAAANFPWPVSVLASGDSVRAPDIRIQEVVTNDWVRKNSHFPVRVYFNTGEYSGSGFKVQITGPVGVIDEKVIAGDNRSLPYAEFFIQSADKGVMQFEARIVPDVPDKNQDNNTKRFVVKIIEREGEILLLYDAPHPDIDAMVQTLRGTNSLNVSVVSASTYEGGNRAVDLVILHGLPSVKHPLSEVVRKFTDDQTPILFVIGKGTDPVLFNRINHGMLLDNPRRVAESARGILNPAFTLFTLPQDFASHTVSWPPLQLAFEVYKPDPGSVIMLNQKILSIELADPLVVFTNTRGIKYGFICGEGIWLWRLHEFLEQKNHDYFDEWFSRSVQYLLTDEKKDRFTVTLPEELFAYSPVRVNAHLLNSSLEAVNEPDVMFTLTDSSGRKTEYGMGRTNDYYELYLNGVTPGIYQYAAESKLGNETFRREGSMTMMVRPIEQNSPVADFESLRFIASSTGGKFFGPFMEMDSRNYLKDLSPSEIKVKKEFKWYDLINFKWLLPLLVVLLTLEWFLRRWYGIR